MALGHRSPRSAPSPASLILVALPTISAVPRTPLATSAVTLCDQVACDPRRAVPNRPQIIQPLDVQTAIAVTPGWPFDRTRACMRRSPETVPAASQGCTGESLA